jgi:hypothetical protein
VTGFLRAGTHVQAGRRPDRPAPAQLTTFRALRDELASETSNHEHHRYWLLTISADEHTARATLAWAEKSLDALAGLGPEEPEI